MYFFTEGGPGWSDSKINGQNTGIAVGTCPPNDAWLQVIFIGIAPRKSCLPTSKPQ